MLSVQWFMRISGAKKIPWDIVGDIFWFRENVHLSISPLHRSSIWICMYYTQNIWIYAMWRFPQMGVTPIFIHFRLGFSTNWTNHSGDPPFLEPYSWPTPTGPAAAHPALSSPGQGGEDFNQPHFLRHEETIMAVHQYVKSSPNEKFCCGRAWMRFLFTRICRCQSFWSPHLRNATEHIRSSTGDDHWSECGCMVSSFNLRLFGGHLPVCMCQLTVHLPIPPIRFGMVWISGLCCAPRYIYVHIY